MKTSATVLAVCVALVFLAGAAQACTLNDMAACVNSVTKNAPPTAACCAKVATVDVPCFCNLVKNGNYPQAYVNNAVTVPAKCGGAAYMHFKGQNCAGHQIN